MAHATQQSVQQPRPPTFNSTTENEALVTGTNGFAVALYRALSARGENSFVSPASISFALAMTYAGAAGGTSHQMTEVLGLAGIPESAVHPGLGALHTTLLQQANCTLHLANRLYCQAGFNTLPAFLELIGQHYQAEAQQVDFGDASTHKGINAWVEKQTNNKIRDLLTAPLDALTRLVLVNAIYFKGDWAAQFAREATRQAPFYLLGGGAVQVDMMHIKRKLRLARIKDLHATLVDLPYKGGDVSMWLVIPEDKDGLPALENGLTERHLAGVSLAPAPRGGEVKLWMPKFRLEQQCELSEQLQSLGMRDVFAEGLADLSKMDGTRQLYLSKVVHKAFIEVNEEGSEAAAATAAVIMTRSMPAPPFEIRADHPFIFLIRDNRSQLILFMGKLEVPTPAEKDEL